MKNTFTKEERLCNKKSIADLFHKGSSFLLYPYRIVYYVSQESPFKCQVLISVPKKRFKRAVDRNKIKRKIRESYRLQKSEGLYPFLDQHSLRLLLSIQYIGDKEIAYDELCHRLNNAFKKLTNEILKVHLGKNS